MDINKTDFFHKFFNELSNHRPIQELKGETDLPTTFNWEKVYKIIMYTTKDYRLILFAIRFIHRFIGTKVYLNELKKNMTFIALFVYTSQNLLPTYFFIVHLLQKSGHACPFGFCKTQEKEFNFIKKPLLLVKCQMIK